MPLNGASQMVNGQAQALPKQSVPKRRSDGAGSGSSTLLITRCQASARGCGVTLRASAWGLERIGGGRGPPLRYSAVPGTFGNRGP